MNLLVTGGCGFIGSNFIRRMLAAHPSYRIVNLDRQLKERFGMGVEIMNPFRQIDVS